LLLLANGLEQDPPGAFRRTIGFVETVMERAGITRPLRVTAAVTDGTAIHALRYSTLIQPETLYVRRLKRADGHLMASEPLDDGRTDWEIVPPQSLVSLAPDGVRIESFVPERPAG
ncbi:MAG: class II glutamine amidotransferase, partial [Hyphomicrobiaceae bacterium]